ncbi:MAG: 50S ribosomal protein L30 [Eubacteriales bacterium]|nr:50S ribosomal protein L30 [Eubacteriales bacterium]MDD3072855.1 50S ribosomal protein L30 [Eubacteriales bacterium]MDD4078677.1 50S ribosomal protein L30 [Eubacteriales bacterium]MDD4768188.1 50S ribosomal protein L30 [Eubacteriales bacterium]
MEKQIQIKLVRSSIGRPKDQRLTLKALGFSKLNQIVSKPDNTQVRGMIAKVAHLVQVIE